MTCSEEALRKQTLLEFGMGIEAMKRRKVCRLCGMGIDSRQEVCPDCGAPLPRENLYDAYKAMHLYCPCCGEVVTDDAVYCPQCGKALRMAAETGATPKSV